MAEERRKVLAEVAVAYGGVAAATGLIAWLAGQVSGLAGYEQLLLGGLFLVLAMRLAQREKDGMRRYGIDLSGLLVRPDADDERPAGPLGVFDLARAIRGAWRPGLEETGVAVLLAALIFPPFVVGFIYWNEPTHAFEWLYDRSDLEFALTQLLVVALPEEAFFRGYVQTRLSDAFPAKKKILGLELSIVAWLGQALLFAAIHFVSIPHPARLAVFFPALLFGLLRCWRGGIGAAILLHAMSNVLAHTLERGFHL